jgi:Asp-tRNA(Asn)/Glu-tRNA(Gln) amidotransferase A subunit family amidase
MVVSATSAHPFTQRIIGTMNLTELSALELRRLIGTRQISPVELMEACIAQIEKYNPAINAIAATDFDRARETAKKAETSVMRGESLGLLHGLPLGVKDLQDTAGLLTTYGNVGLRGNIPTLAPSRCNRDSKN